MWKPTLIDLVSKALGFDNFTILQIAKKAPTTYKRYKIPKKRSGFRTILHPSKETKSLQYTLMCYMEEILTPHKCAMGFVRNLKSPLRKNAEIHAEYAFSIRVDFENFFPSISPNDLFCSIESLNNPAKVKLTQEEKDFLMNVFFVKTNGESWGLPVGAPSSPMISNGVMRELDVQISSFASKHEFMYTRYADDLIFSTNKKGVSKEFYLEFKKIISACQTPKLTINENKTQFMSRKFRRRVTGLIISPNRTVSIGRKRKRYIKKLLFDFNSNTLDENKFHHLQGHLACILDLEPAFFNRLCNKYGAELVYNALKQRGDNPKENNTNSNMEPQAPPK